MEYSSIIDQTKIQANEKKFTLRELVFKYLSHLPLFLLSIAICVGAATIYIRYAIPVYKATANMLVKTGDDNTLLSNAASNDLINNTLFGGRRVNFDNEVERLRSTAYLSRVVAENNLNIKYYNEGNIKRSDIYNSSPFEMTPLFIPDSSIIYGTYVVITDAMGGELKNKKEAKSPGIPFRWGEPISFKGVKCILKPRKPYIQKDLTNPYYVEWNPINKTTAEIRSNLLISSLNAKTTIIQMTITSPNAEEGKYILDAIIKVYQKVNIEDKNRVSQNTIDFINDRLNVVTGELNKVTNELQDFNNKNGILDIPKQFGFYLDNYYNDTKTDSAIIVTKQVLNLLEDYLIKAPTRNKTVPSTLGIIDPTLTQLVGQYNVMQLKRLKDSVQLNSNSPLLEDDIHEVENLRRSLIENLHVLRKDADLREAQLEKQLGTYKTNLYSLPQKAIEQNEIVRQQTIQQQLYLYLLQKREETAITASATTSDYQQLNAAEASATPIEPRETAIRLFSILLGLLIPVLVIYALDMLNDKLTTRDDIVRRTHLPIVGEISHVDKTLSNIIVGQSRNMIAEQFRILRSNLQFMIKNGNESSRVFLITSSISGEGKSFISLNLAAVISLSGKKVALMEFDLRKMRSHRYEGERQNSKGITNYLIGQTDNPAEVITSLDKFPQLHIFRSGPIPPNPGELVMGEKVKGLFDWLKANYDYIVIDSAPVGLVSDSFAFVQFSDAILYVLRQRYTFKKQIEFLDDITKQGKLQHVALIVNDVHMGGKYGYYGYGYGYGYGYIYRYGFGYRYGYGYGAYAGKYFKRGTDGYFDLPGKKK